MPDFPGRAHRRTVNVGREESRETWYPRCDEEPHSHAGCAFWGFANEPSDNSLRGLRCTPGSRRAFATQRKVQRGLDRLVEAPAIAPRSPRRSSATSTGETRREGDPHGRHGWSRLTFDRRAVDLGVAARDLHGHVAENEQQRRQQDLSHVGHARRLARESFLIDRKAGKRLASCLRPLVTRSEEQRPAPALAGDGLADTPPRSPSAAKTEGA